MENGTRKLLFSGGKVIKAEMPGQDRSFWNLSRSSTYMTEEPDKKCK